MNRIEIPAATEIVSVQMSDGAEIILRRYGQPDGPRLAFSHGNGLAIDAYTLFWQQFSDSHDVIVFDMRNHGRNPRHLTENHTWDRISRDLFELFGLIAAAFGPKPVAGIFHSLSAISSVRQLAQHGRTWRQLVLFDPPMRPPDGHCLAETYRENLRSIAELARRRPQTYSSCEEFAGQLRERRRFKNWMPGTHDLFARTTLRETVSEGCWELACPRELEAHIFATNTDPAVWQCLAAGLEVPVTIVGADPHVENQEAPALICKSLADESGIDYVSVPGTTHLLQLEEPVLCADIVKSRTAAFEAADIKAAEVPLEQGET